MAKLKRQQTLTGWLLFLCVSAEMFAGDHWAHVKFSQPDDLLVYFHKHDYSLDNWKKGDRSVPRFYLTHIPDWWGSHYADEATTAEKKRYFFFAMMPMVLRANESILEQRESLLRLKIKASWNAADKKMLAQLADEYSIPAPESVNDKAAMERMLKRVDIVPISLAMAQGAIESGWGTSRFASEGNALFGQWTWGDSAITPERVRTELGNYGIRAFKTPFESITAYMQNLNTNNAYKEFRTIRAQQRKSKQPLSGYAMAAGLQSYSERGDAYIKELRSMIRVNKLKSTDQAYLRDNRVVMLEPVDANATDEVAID